MGYRIGRVWLYFGLFVLPLWYFFAEDLPRAWLAIPLALSVWGRLRWGVNWPRRWLLDQDLDYYFFLSGFLKLKARCRRCGTMMDRVDIEGHRLTCTQSDFVFIRR